MQRVAVFLLLVLVACSQDEPSWNYKDVAAWPIKFPTCGEKQQSPINIETSSVLRNESSGALSFSSDCGVYDGDMLNVTNTGHTISATIIPGLIATKKCSLRVGDESTQYELQQFHFHVTSEHTVNGNSMPMVSHLVFKTPGENGTYAVVAAMMVNSEAPGASLAEFALASIPAVGETISIVGNMTLFTAARNAAMIDPSQGSQSAVRALLVKGDLVVSGDKAAYYTYNGSFTTPPCTEGIRWFVMRDTTYVSRATAQRFLAAIPNAPNGNVRPTEALNGRTVFLWDGVTSTPQPPPPVTNLPGGNPPVSPPAGPAPTPEKDEGSSIAVIIIIVLAIVLFGGGIGFLIKTGQMQQFQETLKKTAEDAKKSLSKTGEKVQKKAEEMKDKADDQVKY